MLLFDRKSGPRLAIAINLLHVPDDFYKDIADLTNVTIVPISYLFDDHIDLFNAM